MPGGLHPDVVVEFRRVQEELEDTPNREAEGILGFQGTPTSMAFAALRRAFSWVDRIPTTCFGGNHAEQGQGRLYKGHPILDV